MSVTRWCDVALDAVLVLLASWTLTYHLCLVLGLGVPVALGVELVLLVGTTLLWRWPRPTTDPDPGPVPASPVPLAGAGRAWSRGVRTVVVLAAVAALALATHAPWVTVWVPFLAASGLGLVLAARSQRDRPGTLSAGTLSAGTPSAGTPSAGTPSAGTPSAGTAGPGGEPAPRPGREVAVVLLWAVGLAVLSSFVLRSNPDDLYYLNLSQWTAENGTFPLRDVLFSNLALPMANWPPTASYDALVGSAAHLLRARAATVAYVVVTPLATFLSVLALWRLLRAWRIVAVAGALSVGLVFLLVDGGFSYATPGNLFLTRLWQGKVVLLCVVVPLLLAHLLAYVEAPTRRGAARLFVGGVAAVGLSTTALFLVPVIAVGGALPLLVRRRWRTGGLGLLALAAYPLGGAVATVALGGYSADQFGMRRTYRFDPSWFGHEIFVGGRLGLLAVVAVLAVLLGALLLPHPAARTTTGALVVVLAITFVPGVTEVGFGLVGLGPTLWRLSWACTVAALVGVLVVTAGARLRPGRVRVGAAVLALVLTVTGAAPIWGAGTSAGFAAPLQWKRGEATRSVTSWILASTEPGDVVLAPDAVSITVAVTTARVKTVAPRVYYLDPLRDVASFDYPARRLLSDLANQVATPSVRAARRALRTLEVQVVCLHALDVAGARLMRGLAWTPGLRTTSYRCWLYPR